MHLKLFHQYIRRLSAAVSDFDSYSSELEYFFHCHCWRHKSRVNVTFTTSIQSRILPCFVPLLASYPSLKQKRNNNNSYENITD